MRAEASGPAALVREVGVPALFVVLWSTGFIGAKLGLPHAVRQFGPNISPRCDNAFNTRRMSRSSALPWLRVPGFLPAGLPETPPTHRPRAFRPCICRCDGSLN